jgi:hypothetical protein
VCVFSKIDRSISAFSCTGEGLFTDAHNVFVILP